MYSSSQVRNTAQQHCGSRCVCSFNLRSFHERITGLCRHIHTQAVITHLLLRAKQLECDRQKHIKTQNVAHTAFASVFHDASCIHSLLQCIFIYIPHCEICRTTWTILYPNHVIFAVIKYILAAILHS